MNVVVGYEKWEQDLEGSLDKTTGNSWLTPNLNSHGTPKNHGEKPDKSKTRGHYQESFLFNYFCSITK